MNPIYPNCFDLLTTHGIVADDVVGYITGEPSPYLQNYVAHRAGVPTVPGQILPDGLPNVPRRGEVYGPKQDTYQPQTPPPLPEAPHKKNGWDTAKKVAAGLLIAGLAGFGIYKGKDFITKLFKSAPKPAPAPAGSANPWYKQAGNWISTKYKAASAWVGAKATAVGDWFKNIFTRKPKP